MTTAPRLDGRGEIPDSLWARLSELVGRTLGLHFPPARLGDLQVGVEGAARDLGFTDLATGIESLLSRPLTREQLQVLASRLTVGETYFRRDDRTFDVLAQHVLPQLIAARRGRQQQLRIWSAACCTGEEAYSLATVLHQLLPDIAEWRVSILATDINVRFLAKGVAGSFSDWSFRGTQTGFRQRYFTRVGGDRHAIRPEIKKLVTFRYLNLIEDAYPSSVTDTNEMDLVLCRNVLMYFAPEHLERVVGKLYRSLADGGWLGVGASETSQDHFKQFTTRNFPGVVLYQKGGAAAHEERPANVALVRTGVTEGITVPAGSPTESSARRESLPPAPVIGADGTARRPDSSAAPWRFEEGSRSATSDPLRAADSNPPTPAICALLARAMANLGRLDDALVWCDRWIASDKMDPAAHYVRAIVLIEHGSHDEARRSLDRVIYLDPSSALAQFALGNLSRAQGRVDDAVRYFTNSVRLLGRLPPDTVLEDADGMTAGSLASSIATLTAREQAS